MGWCTGPAFIFHISVFTVCCCCCVCDQEDDGDDDTLTTDTLSPEANDSSRSSDSQVGAFQTFLLFFYHLFCFPAFPRMPLLSRRQCMTVCVCAGPGSPAGGAAAQRGAAEPRPNHRTAHPAAGGCPALFLPEPIQTRYAN